MANGQIQSSRSTPRWILYGAMGMLSLIATQVLDFLVCGRSTRGPLCGVLLSIDRVCQDCIEHIGRLFGARYGYVPYFPNTATKVFLDLLGYTLPWVSFFILGVLAYAVAHRIRSKMVLRRKAFLKR